MPCIRSAGVIVITTFIIDGTCICKAGLVFLTSIITNGTLIELAGIAVITRSISDLCRVNSAKHYTCIEAITTIRANFVVTALDTSVRSIATVVASNLFNMCSSIICEETFRFHEFKKEDKSWCERPVSQNRCYIWNWKITKYKRHLRSLRNGRTEVFCHFIIVGWCQSEQKEKHVSK